MSTLQAVAHYTGILIFKIMKDGICYLPALCERVYIKMIEREKTVLIGSRGSMLGIVAQQPRLPLATLASYIKALVLDLTSLLHIKVSINASGEAEDGLTSGAFCH